jgi:hypothetical protein
MAWLPTLGAVGHLPRGQDDGLDAGRTSWHNPIAHKSSIAFVHFSRHVSGPNEGRKTFVTDGSPVRHVGTSHTHPPGLLWGVLITANQYRFFALEVGFDTTILVGSLTTGSVCAEETNTGNGVSEWSMWRWPRKRVHATDTETHNHTTRSRGCTLNVVVYGVIGKHDSVFISGYRNGGRLKTTFTLQHTCHNFTATCIQLHR